MNNKSLPGGTRLNSTTDSYTIENVIGTGGFGITYKAYMPTKVRNIVTKAPVAIKEHFPSADCERDATSTIVTCSSMARQRVDSSLKDFIEEAEHLQQIANLHPNIVKVNEVFQANGTAYYVMEYLEGETLRDYVQSRGKLTVEQTLSIMMPVIEAVATLHQNRFTHLDIKPSNIMLTTDENGKFRPVLIDFGLARHYNSDGSATDTVASMGFSEGYAPVEQYSGITRFSPQVDVYSIGATLLYCLTGERPPRSSEISMQMLNSIIPASLPSKLRKLIMYAMAYNQMDRLPNAVQLYSSLKSFAESEGIELVPSNISIFAHNDMDTTVAFDNDNNDGDTRTKSHYTDTDNTITAASDNTIISTPPVVNSGGGGGKKSNKAKRVSSNRYNAGTVNNNRYERQMAKPGTPAWIWVTIGGLMVALAIAGVLVYKTLNSDNKRPDDVPVLTDDTNRDNNQNNNSYSGNTPAPAEEIVEVKVEEDTPARVKDGAVTPDLGFHTLSGPVKSCTNQWGAYLPFNERGQWTGNYSDNLGPRTFSRDSNGRIVSESYNSSEFGPGTIYYTWDGNNIVSMVDENRDQSVYYTYNSDGSMATQSVYNKGKVIEYDFYGEKRDGHGNWTSRSYTRKTTDANGSVSRSSGTQKRTISYY
ncbi:MAG: serine/threonine protein kinase [Firmicutes bacterium]|nr:serine/threonine protein kinase [Bacillota bacterium]MCM1400485.1 serine/threonine protein kinase [Bacteroides sp.]